MSYETIYQRKRRIAAQGCKRCKAARLQFHVQFPNLTPSNVVDHGDLFCAEQSVETWGPDTYNHPKGYVQVRA